MMMSTWIEILLYVVVTAILLAFLAPVIVTAVMWDDDFPEYGLMGRDYYE